VLLLLVILSGSATAENETDKQNIKQAIAKGKRLIREGNYLQATRVFEGLAGQYPNSSDIDQFIFYRAKAKYYFGDYADAIAGFSFFISRFPDSQQKPYALFLQANAYYRNGDLNNAFKQYLNAYQLSNDLDLNEMILNSLAAMYENASSVDVHVSEFGNLPEKKKCLLIDKLAPVLITRNMIQEAKNLLAICDNDLVISDTQSTRKKTDLEIAMLLPLSGDLNSFGQDIYNGAIIASEMYRTKHKLKVNLTPYDTYGDPVSAARIAGDLNNSTIDAIIGPLTSEEAAVVSARMNKSQLPVLIPAATEAGITLLSESSFQLSPNIELQGIRMAEYAINELNADSAALITSTAKEHLLTSRAFVERFKELGGTIVAIEYYRSRDKDFGKYIRDIKAVMLGVTQDSTYYIDERGDTVKVDIIPVHLDCLFIPGDQRQVRLLLPQINFYNINTLYLGTDGWGDDAIYRLGDDITKGAIFPSPFMNEAQTDGYAQFAALYDSRYGEKPKRLSNLGYDAMTLLCQAYLNNGRSTSSLTEQIKQTNKYGGASGIITFGTKRENVEMPLYRIIAEEAVPLEQTKEPSQTGSTE